MRFVRYVVFLVFCAVSGSAEPYAWTYADAAGDDESTTVYVWAVTDGSHGGSDYTHSYAAFIQVQAPSGSVILNVGGWAPVNSPARADGNFVVIQDGEYYPISSHEAICSYAGQFLYAPGWFPVIKVGQAYTSYATNNPYPLIFTKACLGLEANTCGPLSFPASPLVPSAVWRQYIAIKIGSNLYCIQQGLQSPGWVGCFVFQ
jgi:hypothetical protein